MNGETRSRHIKAAPRPSTAAQQSARIVLKQGGEVLPSSRDERRQIFTANRLLAEPFEQAVDLGQIETGWSRDLDANGPAVLRVVHQESPASPLSPSALLAVAARQVIVGSQWAALAIRDALNGFQAAAWK